MNYKIFVDEQINKSAGLRLIIEKIKSIKNKKCLVFVHDDPDGLTSGVIIKRIIQKCGGKVVLRVPETMELEKFRIENELKISNYDILFIVDKATMDYYNEYPELIKDVIVIDHHPLIGKFPDKCIVFNPSIPEYTFCSCSLLCNIIAEAVGLRDDFCDFQALLGMKCDWAIEPATEFVAPFCQIFYDEAKQKFKNILTKISDRPTMFEVSQREKTTLLNQIGEFFFALSGGGFQYFYNDRIPELKNQPEFCFEMLDSLNVKDYENFSDFLDALKERKLSEKIYKCFLDDWQKAMSMFDNSFLIDEYEGVKIYFFIGENVPLMPMAGSVKLYEFGGPASFIMVNWQGKEKGVHISFRANTDKIHWGNFSAKLTERITSKFGHKGEISGGGHIRASEFRTRTSGLSLSKVLKEFFALFEEIINKNEL